MTDLIEEGARHATHEMVRFLEIHMELHGANGPLNRHSSVVIHALRTAYATHVRNLLEFFHEKCEGDVVYGDLLASNGNPYKEPDRKKWPQPEQDWWLQASQLASHLAGNRSDYEDLPEWEDRGCEKVLVRMISDAVEKTPNMLRHGRIDGTAVLEEFMHWWQAV